MQVDALMSAIKCLLAAVPLPPSFCPRQAVSLGRVILITFQEVSCDDGAIV
jgi:hypothetical protein